MFIGLVNFTGSLASIVNTPNYIKYIFLNNQQCMTQPINLHPTEYIDRSCYSPFAVNLDTCIGSCNTLSDLSNKVCVLKQNRKFKFECFQYDNRNKWVENINKAYIIQM